MPYTLAGNLAGKPRGGSVSSPVSDTKCNNLEYTSKSKQAIICASIIHDESCEKKMISDTNEPEPENARQLEWHALEQPEQHDRALFVVVRAHCSRSQAIEALRRVGGHVWDVRQIFCLPIFVR